MREESVLEDDAVVVEVVDGIKNGADDGDGIVFNKLALCEDTVNSLSTGGELKGKAIFCVRLKALLKLDQGRRGERGDSKPLETVTETGEDFC